MKLEEHKRGKLDLSKWIEEEMVTSLGIGQNGAGRKREKCNMELEEGAGTDLMNSLKTAGGVRLIDGGVGQEWEILYLKKKLHPKLELVVQ